MRVLGEMPGLIERMAARREEFIAATFAEIQRRTPELTVDDADMRREVAMSLIAANWDYGIETSRRGVSWSQSAEWPTGEPVEAADSARFIARRGIPLERLLSAYRGAHAVVWDMWSEEILALGADEPVQAQLLKGTSHAQFAYLDHLITVASEAYTREFERLTRGREQRRVKLVSRLLAGGGVSSDELGYRLADHHLALVVRGTRAESAADEIAEATEYESLLVSRGHELAWLWLGDREPFDERVWERLRAQPLPAGVVVATGESQSAREGFRLSHRQAQAADRASSGRPLVRYADVALLSAVLEQETARASFVALFLGELAGQGNRNATLRETLKAYFSAGHNAASAAAALGVHERTVRYRIRAIEQLLGYAVDARRPELEVALRIVHASAASRADL